MTNARPSATKVLGLLTCVALAGSAAGCSTDGIDDGAVVLTAEDALVKPAEVDRFWKQYQRDEEDIAKQWRSDNGGRPWGGDYLAWKESFLETALVDMYIATRDLAFADELVKRIDVVFSLRDDAIGRKDEVRGKVVPGWGRYPDVGRDTRTGDWVVEMVQNGLITYPIAELVAVGEKDSALKARHGAKLARYRDKLVETVDLFDTDWDDSGSEGFYRFPKGYGKVYPPHEGRYLPYNRAVLLGRTMVMLEETNIPAAKKARYRERVRNMARFFLRDAHEPGNRYVWAYATWAPTVEDTSHGGLDVDFFAVAGHHDYADIGRGDIERFIETFKEITKDDTKLAGHVNGDAGGDRKDNNEACGRYLDLAAYEPALVKRCAKVVARGEDYKQIAFAKTLRYRGR